jgi:hypothetical protein
MARTQEIYHWSGLIDIFSVCMQAKCIAPKCAAIMNIFKVSEAKFCKICRDLNILKCTCANSKGACERRYHYYVIINYVIINIRQIPNFLLGNCVETRRPDIRKMTGNQYGKTFYIFLLFCTRNIKKEIFRVDIKLCQHGS